MSSILRKYERNIVKRNIEKDKRSVKKCFENEWKEHREKKYVIKDSDGNVVSDMTPKNTMKRKQIHFDNVEQYNRLLAFADTLKNKNKEEVVGKVEN